MQYLSPDNWLMELKKHLTIETDATLLMSISQQNRVQSTENLFVYVWDLYEWAVKGVRAGEYDYKRYGELLRLAKRVWCPSEGTKARLMQFYGVESEVIHTFVPIFKHPTVNLGFVYQPLREQPDKNWGLVERACKELSVPVITHESPYEQYKATLASCSVVVSGLSEASTGSLSLIEAAYLGKPCLVSDSPYNGGSEYLPGVATFKDGDIEDLKKKLLEGFKYTAPSLDYSIETMGQKICDSISAHTGK